MDLGRPSRIRFATGLLIVSLFGAAPGHASGAGGATQAVPRKVPAPAEVIGFELGSDYLLADYGQVLRYFQALDAASDRVRLEEIGKTTLGKPMVVAVISSEENLKSLERHRDTSRRLALARDVTDDEARRLAKESRVTVWIDGGLHSSEVAHSQHTPELAWWLATDESEEARRIRDHVITLVCANLNPDGLDIVVNWYRKNVGTPFETAPLPELYHHYVGHDNNRDWYMFTQAESTQVARVFYERWFPQIVYNHHQTGPFPGRIWVPPAIDPLSPTLDPLVVSKFGAIGQYMLTRFMREGKPGVSTGIGYRVVWAGGYMTAAPQLHNMVGLFTETALYNYATPHCYSDAELGDTFSRGIALPTRTPSVHYPVPWKGGCWRVRDAMDYMMTGSRAVLDHASKLREEYLYDVYHMGRRQIARGERAEGGPHAHVIDVTAQHDPAAAVELLRILRTGGVEIQRASQPFTADGRAYPAGTYVVPPQAFRPFVLDLLEPKDHPDRFLHPGGPAEPPYDFTGYSLPLQMGVRVERVKARIPAVGPVVGDIGPPAGGRVGRGAVGWLLSRKSNWSVLAVNRLLKAGASVAWIDGSADLGGRRWDAGTFVVRGVEAAVIDGLVKQLGLEFVGIDSEPAVTSTRIRAPRVGIYQSYLANMAEGWTRWVLDQYEFNANVLHDQDLRAGNLSAYDVIILPDQDAQAILRGHARLTMPAEFVGGVGAEGSAALTRFVERGGWIVATHEAVGFAAEQFGLPIRNVVEGASTRDFYAPGSLLRLEVDRADPLGFGMANEAVITTWQHALVMDVVPAAGEKQSQAGERLQQQDAIVYARFPKEHVKADGWVIGERRYLASRAAAVRVPLGKGQVVLLGFRPDTRGQSRNVFKMLFNPLYAATAGQSATGREP